MANEFRYGIDQNGVRHPVCDDTRVDWASYAVLGAKNLLENTASSSNNFEGKGVDFTVNVNKSVFVNGTPTADIYFTVNQKFAKEGTFILSGMGANGTSNFRLQAYIYNSSDVFQRSATDSGSGIEFTINSGEYARVQIVITTTQGTISNKTVYPMIRLATDPNPTYAPPAMTNEELTEIKDVELTPQTGVTLSADTRLSVTGNMASLSFQATADITASANNRLFNFSTDYKPKAITYGIAIINSTTVARIYIDTYGIAWLWGTSALTGATIQGSLTWIING